MKKCKLITILAMILLCLPAAGQEQKEIVLKTDVSDATVFINGAQVLRRKAVDLLPGKTKIRFTNLSPYIDPKSVQVKMDGEVMVTSVNHQSNFLDSIKKITVSKTQEAQLQEIADNIALEKINQEVIIEELQFLGQNKSIGGSNNGVSLLALKETSNYYRDRVLALKLKSNEISKKIKTLELEKIAVQNEGKQEGNTDKRTPIGEVVVEVECEKAARINAELTYYVRNAGWYPTYDIRAINVDKPIQLIYKANVRQNTQEDWRNVKLKISSADPNLGNVAPQLKTYYLNYHTSAPRYDAQIDNNQITGTVVEAETNEPLIGVSVAVKGTTIGTVTDVDGRFSLAIPRNSNSLTFSYIGYKVQTLPVSRSYMNVRMVVEAQSLAEVVTVGYGTQLEKAGLVGAASGVKIRGAASISAPKAFDRDDIVMPTARIENQTAVEFDIKIPYTVKSDNKNTVVEVERYELPADYEYFAIPKISKDAFLLANITDWEKYNLLDGEANIFFENTYIGKTILETRYVSDTLNISLGRDKGILVNREKGKDYNTKKFFGGKKEDTRVWKTTVRNNKKQTVNFVVLDQVPVSTTAEIEVETETPRGGALNAATGEVKWRMELKPGDKKEMELKYKVKYPKDKTLTIE